MNPYQVVSELEKRIADFCGAPHAVAVESGTAAIFLSLMYVKFQNKKIRSVRIPKYTYPSVPCSIIHAGGKVVFEDNDWKGEYQLYPYPIWDAALRFKKKMYHGGLQCLSMHIKKRLNVGRGGIILCEDEFSAGWLKRARFDGRSPVPLKEDKFNQLGWNMYLEPANAARAIQIFETLRNKRLPDLKVEEQGYPDLSQFKIYTQ